MVVTNETGERTTVETMELTGGDVSLDFANTLSDRGGATPGERLRAYGDLVTWAQRTELIGREEAERLRRAAEESPAEAAAVLERARALRESIFRLFTEGEAAAADVARVGEAAAEAAAMRRLEAGPDGYALAWRPTGRLERPLWPVALAAVELLTSEDRARVRECAAGDCRWLFLDMSRNRSRRWCDMKVCGNRAKARRFSARQKRGAR